MMTERGDLERWLEAHAEDPLVKRAHLLAAGLGSIEDKRDHLQDLMKLANRIATPLPYDPGRRHLSTEAVDNSPQSDCRAREGETAVEEVMF
jgi:hypothetical protein